MASREILDAPDEVFDAHAALDALVVNLQIHHHLEAKTAVRHTHSTTH